MKFYISLEQEYLKRAADAFDDASRKLKSVGSKLYPLDYKDLSVDARKKKPYYIRSRW